LSKLGDMLGYAIRQSKRLFNALVGFTFLILGVVGGLLSYQEWRIYQRVPDMGPIRFGLFAGFTVFLFILGLYSFAKARSVR
jgi:hypothetical protein